jgi:predicted O-methyltransferase YrrM
MSEFVYVKAGDKPVKYVAHRADDDPGCMHDWQLAFVEKLAMEAPRKHFLEVGVWRGQTTRCLAQNGYAVAVDTFSGSEEIVEPGKFNDSISQERLSWFLQKADEEGVADRITVLVGTSDNVLPFLRYSEFGLVLIDANHATPFAYRDIKNTWPTIVPGGWLLLDDFSTADVYPSREPSVRWAWERFAGENGLGRLPLYTNDESHYDETLVTYGPKLVGIRKPA